MGHLALFAGIAGLAYLLIHHVNEKENTTKQAALDFMKGVATPFVAASKVIPGISGEYEIGRYPRKPRHKFI